MAKKNKDTASEATANDDDADDDASDATSDDAGNPTEDAAPGENTAPDGQTSAGSPELGPASDDFEDPITRLDHLGRADDTRVEKEGEEKAEVPKLFTSLTKALGHRKSDLLGYNARTRVAVYSNGGKYQVSRNGKSLRHLAGPKPPRDLKLDVVDARSRSPFIGTAAAINASVHTDPQSTLQGRREALVRELAAVEAQLAEA